MGTRGRRGAVMGLDGFVILVITLLLGCRRARAESSVEFSGATGFGALALGVTPARFAVSPSASVSLRGDGWFLVARDTASFLGATGDQFGIHNETTLGAGLFGKLVNVSAGLSLAGVSLPICGPRLCGQVHGLAPALTCDSTSSARTSQATSAFRSTALARGSRAARRPSGTVSRCAALRGPSFVSLLTPDHQRIRPCVYFLV